jgi:hypothetical protein
MMNSTIQIPTELEVFSEPRVEFRYGQGMEDPHDGLSLFGPYDTDLPSHPRNISYGAIGTRSGLERFSAWAQSIRAPVNSPGDKQARIWPLFPGFEAAFASAWPDRPTRETEIDETELLNASSDLDANKRAFDVVELYLNAIEAMHKRDDQLGVIVCVVPDVVYANCRPRSHVARGRGYRPRQGTINQRKKGQGDMFDPYPLEMYQYSVDFRRQIKARSMKFGIPIQIVQESTLSPDGKDTGRRLTPLSDRAWNLGVGLYYKAGGKPWKLASARDGVCYIGISYRLQDPKSNSACCAAQMFLDSGDGIVFMGEFGPWYSEKRKAFHLPRENARALLAGVLSTYDQLDGRPLKEVFLHCRSHIDEEEFAGFKEACPPSINLVGIRVRQERDEVRLMREGKYPVLRGTFWPVTSRTAYLWGSGFKPRLGTYDGWETPAPLRIELQHGDADIHQVGRDILGLTKLNYNACKLGDAEPVTIGFSDAVGEILVSNPTVTDRRPNFKFYI